MTVLFLLSPGSPPLLLLPLSAPRPPGRCSSKCCSWPFPILRLLPGALIFSYGFLCKLPASDSSLDSSSQLIFLPRPRSIIKTLIHQCTMSHRPLRPSILKLKCLQVCLNTLRLPTKCPLLLSVGMPPSFISVLASNIVCGFLQGL